MERIKEELSVRERKVLFSSEATGFSAFITPAHNGIAVAKLIQDNEGAIRSAEKPTYHQDMPRAIFKMSRLEADAGFEENKFSSWLKLYDESNERLIAKFEQLTQQQENK